MDRTVDDVNAYISPAPGKLEKIGRGVTHYRTPWVPGMRGEDIHQALMAAGLPDTARVMYRPDEGVLDIAVLLDDQEEWAEAVKQVVAAHVAGL